MVNGRRLVDPNVVKVDVGCVELAVTPSQGPTPAAPAVVVSQPAVAGAAGRDADGMPMAMGFINCTVYRTLIRPMMVPDVADKPSVAMYVVE